MENNVVTNGQKPNFPSSSFEAAMEKISSLITRQRRGEKPPIANKLEMMSLYLKVIYAEIFSKNFGAACNYNPGFVLVISGGVFYFFCNPMENSEEKWTKEEWVVRF